MCTVSYIPIKVEQFILTSNRDERIARPTLSPVAEIIGNTTVFFPKDQQAGGTWIAAGDNGRICCLLNGAFKKHKRKVSYAKSRGKILLEAFEHENIRDFLLHSALDEVEPFTLIVSDIKPEHKLREFRWDAEQKHTRELDVVKPHIWSSATLYSKKIRKQRENWFGSWLKSQTHFDRENIMDFHSFPHGNDPENDVVMERTNGLKTVSITQVEVYPDSFNMHYHDLLKDQKTSLTKGIKRNSYALLR